MRRLRNETGYPDIDKPTAGLDDVDDAVPTVSTMIERARSIIEIMPPY